MFKKLFIIAIFLLALVFAYEKYKPGQKTTVYCQTKTGTSKMSKEEAIEIAKDSDCIISGTLVPFKEVCNDFTGTWWLDLYVPERFGCSPACVIDVETKKADINWRCTGAVPK